MEYYGDEKGNVYNQNDYKLKLYNHRDGYIMFKPYQDGRAYNEYVHRFIYEYYNGKIPKGLEVNHMNENKSDNRLENLELVTQKQNVRKRSYNRLSMEVCRSIRKRYKEEKISSYKLSKDYDCHPSTIMSCINKKTWT
jgi:hypothetical protein